MLAMHKCVEEYNARLGRKIGSVTAAAEAVGELIDIYNAGNQPELNTASYVESILMHYKAVYAYYRLIEFIKDYNDESDWDVRMQALCYRDFKEWFDLNNAINGICLSIPMRLPIIQRSLWMRISVMTTQAFRR